MGRTRSWLAAVAAAGLVVCAIGSSSVVAAFTDTATTGADGDVDLMEHISTAAISADGADIEIAHYPVDPSCGWFADDVALPVYQIDGVTPGQTELGGPVFSGVCVRNAGLTSVSVTPAATDLASVELTCEPLEALVDPDGPTCGAVGESTKHVRYRTTVVAVVDDQLACPVEPAPSGASLPLDQAQPAFALAPGEIACIAIDLAYEPGTAAAAAVAQTDRTRWRFEFTAVTA